MKSVLFAGVCALALSCTIPASAKQWVDYSPQKGYWEVMSVKVDPNKIDDYLTGLKATWVPGAEIAKKSGLIDDYEVMIKLNAADGNGNVLLCLHYTSFANLDPNKKRDQALDKEFEAALPKDKADAAVAGFDKIRTFVGDDIYVPVTFTK
ncbi:MAG TPA: hypothetical protein VGC27_01890 [Rhizomicrobium sp.]